LYITYYSHKYHINIIVTHITVTDVKLDEMVADGIKDTNSDEESSKGDDVYDPALLVCYIISSNFILLLV